MLFSRADVVRVINRRFEPVWESVRPVPLVHIDFGNGSVVTRTLHGNIATYVCDADGHVLDVLPGIYEPKAYLAGLDQLRLLAMYVRQQPQRADVLKAYHRQQAAALTRKQAPPVLVALNAGVTKSGIERGIRVVLMPARPAQAAAGRTPPAKPARPTALTAPEDLASWDRLAEDTWINETVRRRQVHELLAARGPVLPSAVSKWVYKEVLHTDLDDPYLGLGPVLFAGYPFQDGGAH